MYKMYKVRTEIIQYFDDLSNGFTLRLHLLKVNYPMVRALCAMQGAFLIDIWKKWYKVPGCGGKRSRTALTDIFAWSYAFC